MKLLIKIIITFSIIAGCNHDEISDEQRKSETEKIRTRIETFTAAYEKKDMNALIALLSSSNSFYFLGSDVAEKNFNISDFRNQIDHDRSEEHTSELQSRENLVCRLLLEKKKL